MSDVTIYHNPKCGTSRNTLAMIRNAGIEPQVVLYLETLPSRAQLKALFKRAGVGVRDALRERARPMPSWAWTIQRWTTRPCWTPSRRIPSC